MHGPGRVKCNGLLSVEASVQKERALHVSVVCLKHERVLFREVWKV